MDTPEKDINIVDSIFKRPKSTKVISTLFTFREKVESQKINLFKKPPPLGIDIGTNSFKIAKVSPVEQGFMLSNLIMEEFNWDVINNPAVRKDALPRILKTIMEKYKLPAHVYASVPAVLTQIKNIRLAPMPKEEIDSAVRWEIQQASQMKIEDISYDYLILNEEPFLNKNAIEVLAVISAKKDILEYMQILTSAGFKPLAIEIDPMSAISCLSFMNQINPNEIVVFLEMGAGVSTLNIIENNQLRLVRNVALNGNILNSSIREHLNIKPEAAEEIKKNFDCLSLDNESNSSNPILTETAGIIKPLLEAFVLDVEHTFKYYSYQLTRSRAGWFNRVVLSGGFALSKNIDKYLSKHLDAPVQIADPLRRLNISPNVSNIFPDMNVISPRLSVCIGLALRGHVKE